MALLPYLLCFRFSHYSEAVYPHFLPAFVGSPLLHSAHAFDISPILSLPWIILIWLCYLFPVVTQTGAVIQLWPCSWVQWALIYHSGKSAFMWSQVTSSMSLPVSTPVDNQIASGTKRKRWKLSTNTTKPHVLSPFNFLAMSFMGATHLDLLFPSR
jgi:hypothetical protein